MLTVGYTSSKVVNINIKLKAFSLKLQRCDLPVISDIIQIYLSRFANPDCATAETVNSFVYACSAQTVLNRHLQKEFVQVF